MDSNPDTWTADIALNLMSTLHCTHAVLPGMIARSYGRIVNIGSVQQRSGNPDMLPYSMSKASLVHLTTALAKDLARTGVTANLPNEGRIWDRCLFAGAHVLNGFGEMTGLAWLNEAGLLNAPIALTNRQPGTVVEDFASHTAALAWLTATRPALLAAIRQAADSGYDQHAWQLAWALIDFLQRQGHWQDQATSQEIALRSAVRLADPCGQAHAYHGLARATLRKSTVEQAVAEAVRLVRETINPQDQARAVEEFMQAAGAV